MPPDTLPEDTRMQKIFRGKHSERMLAFVSVVESWFMPIIIEPFMILPVLAKPKSWFRIATIVTVFSVIGGIAGYLTGMFFFDIIGARLVALYGAQEYLEKTMTMFNDNVFWVIFAGAFTPLPYKIFTLVGGFLHVNFFMFILASFVGRGLRFYAVAFIVAKFGERAPVFMKQFNIIAVAIGVLLVLYAIHTLL